MKRIKDFKIKDYNFIVFFIFFFVFFFILFSIYFIEKDSSKIYHNNLKNYANSLYENNEYLNTAIFAGGCFWCSEKDFEKINGVVKVISGYAGGNIKNPTYEEVSSGKTDYVESVKVYYNSTIINYKTLLDNYFKGINPTDDKGQFIDRGKQYRPIIFYKTEKEKSLIKEKILKLENEKIFNSNIKVGIIKETTFYPAENYHQDFYKKNPIRYNFYRFNSGRDQFLKKTWNNKNLKKESKNENISKLTELQYFVTQKNGTEKPFKNKYWNNHKEGIYVDVVSGEPLFSSKDKYNSGTGWPSFSKPINPRNIIKKEDNSLFLKRTEIRSKSGNSHLGHLFNDGPKNKGGLRYCINSASLKFIPKTDLKKEGYVKYLIQFN